LLSAAAKAAPKTAQIRFVQIGAVTGSQISLRSDVLRSTSIEIMGSGLGSVPGPRMRLAFFLGVSSVPTFRNPLASPGNVA
jgi:hypothetical protein